MKLWFWVFGSFLFLHPYDGCKWIRCRGETFDVYEAPPPLACILVLETSGSYNYELALCILMI